MQLETSGGGQILNLHRSLIKTSHGKEKGGLCKLIDLKKGSVMSKSLPIKAYNSKMVWYFLD